MPSATSRVMASSMIRKAEAMLIPLFIIGVAGSGIGGFIAHVFISDEIADSIGWDTGSPFQLEVGFANLSIGILGAIAAERRDGFREATVIAATVFAVGATFVHVRDILDTGNLAAGNTIQNVPNLLRPALLIFFLRQSRRAGLPCGDGRAFDAWRAPIHRASVVSRGHRLDSVRGRLCHGQERTCVRVRHPRGRRRIRNVGPRISSFGFVWMSDLDRLERRRDDDPLLPLLGDTDIRRRQEAGTEIDAPAPSANARTNTSPSDPTGRHNRHDSRDVGHGADFHHPPEASFRLPGQNRHNCLAFPTADDRDDRSPRELPRG